LKVALAFFFFQNQEVAYQVCCGFLYHGGKEVKMERKQQRKKAVRLSCVRNAVQLLCLSTGNQNAVLVPKAVWRLDPHFFSSNGLFFVLVNPKT
jgi:hypothetical protein